MNANPNPNPPILLPPAPAGWFAESNPDRNLPPAMMRCPVCGATLIPFGKTHTIPADVAPAGLPAAVYLLPDGRVVGHHQLPEDRFGAVLIGITGSPCPCVPVGTAGEYGAGPVVFLHPRDLGCWTLDPVARLRGEPPFPPLGITPVIPAGTCGVPAPATRVNGTPSPWAGTPCALPAHHRGPHEGKRGDLGRILWIGPRARKSRKGKE